MSTGGKSRLKVKQQGVAVDASLRGRGPARGAGNAGRPREEWKGWLRSIVDSPTTRRAIANVLSDPQHPAFPRVLAWADERGWGKEIQQVEGGMELVVIRRDETVEWSYEGEEQDASGSVSEADGSS